MCFMGGVGGWEGVVGGSFIPILGWDSGNCFNEMDTAYSERLAETAMFCSVFSFRRAESHTSSRPIGKRVEPGVSVSMQGGRRHPGALPSLQGSSARWTLPPGHWSGCLSEQDAFCSNSRDPVTASGL